MAKGQMLPAFIAALVNEGVDPSVVERAVLGAADKGHVTNLGRSVTGDTGPMVRDFAFTQARVLERAWE